LLSTADIYSTEDENKGLVRLSWAAVRDRVCAANPEFCALVDEISPGEEFVFYIAYYPFGAFLGNNETAFLPTMQGGFVPLNKPGTRSNRGLSYDLGYGAHSAPLTMILDKAVELFIDHRHYNLTVPYRLLHAGDFIATQEVISEVASSSFVQSTAGCRSTMMLPPISCSRHFSNIRHKFGKRMRKPDNLYEHAQLFSDLAQHPTAGCDWIMSALLFPHNFIEKIKHDPAWYKIHRMINLSLQMNLINEVQRRQNLKADPYLLDTAHHLYKISAGFTPGFVPASDETYVPRAFLQTVFLDVYGLTQYYPTILHPSYFNLQNANAEAVYYSRQYPTNFVAAYKTRNSYSITHSLSEQQHLLEELCLGLTKIAPSLDNALWLQIGSNVEFCTYHSYKNNQENIKLSSELQHLDPRFGAPGCAVKLKKRCLSEDGAFMRGCIAIRLKSPPAAIGNSVNFVTRIDNREVMVET
jgi:hypothetical protein